MADQRIFFEQGSLTTGDSGERGDSTAAGGGALSVKPVVAGERAAEVVINRPTSNLRKRTEALRTAGEQSKYLQDAGMGWILSAGNAAGLSPGPATMPGISSWDSVAGTFVVTQPVVVQPINTPGSDKQETATYSFTDGLSQTAAIAFTPLSSSTPTVKQKRAYNGANLIRIVWEALTAEELAGATIAGYCNASLSGDPEHILTISIRVDDTTTMAMLTSAMLPLASAAGQIADIGLGYVISGTVSTALEISEVAALDYRMKGTFEREVHYIPTTSFSTFFGSNSLADGDTLSIHFATYTTDADIADPPSGRRERVPSNNTGAYPNNTTVLASDLFITSNADDVYKIPLSIPLCKRIGDDLYWMDGTVVPGTQSTFPVYFGEHGVTVDRGSADATAAISALLASDAAVTGDWWFNDRISLSYFRPTTVDLWSLYLWRRTTEAVAVNLQGITMQTTASHTVTGNVYGIENKIDIDAIVTGNVTGCHTYVTVNTDPGDYVYGSMTQLNFAATNSAIPDTAYASAVTFRPTGAAVPQAVDAGGLLSTVDLWGGTFDNVYGVNISIPTATPIGTGAVIGALCGLNIAMDHPTEASVTDLYGMKIDLTAPDPVTSTYSLDSLLTLQSTYDIAYGQKINVVQQSAAAVGTTGTYGAHVTLDCSLGTPGADSAGIKVVSDSADYGIHAAVTGPGSVGSAGLYVAATAVTAGLRVNVTSTGTSSSRGLLVEANSVYYGAHIDTNATAKGLYVDTITAAVPLHVRRGDDASYSIIERSLTVGGGGPPESGVRVSLHVLGAYQTERTTGTTGGSINAFDKSYISLDTLTTSVVVNSITDGVVGQWLIITNESDSGYTVTFTETLSNIIPAGGGTSVIADKEGILFVYDGSDWREVAHA